MNKLLKWIVKDLNLGRQIHCGLISNFVYNKLHFLKFFLQHMHILMSLNIQMSKNCSFELVFLASNIII